MTTSTTTPTGYLISRQQRRTWAQHAPESCRAVLVITVDDSLDWTNVERRMRLLAETHEILRTQFAARDDSIFPTQVVMPGSIWPLHPLLNLHDFNPANAALGIYVGTGQGAQQNVAIVLPALVADLETLDLIAGTLCGSEAGARTAMQEICQYADYAAWLDAVLRDPVATEQRKNISGHLSEAFNFWRPGRQNTAPVFIPRAVETTLPDDTCAALNDCARVLMEDATYIVLAAWQMFLSSCERTACPPIGLRVPGRHTAELRDAAGPYDLYMPMLSQVQSPAPFEDLVRRTRASAERANEQIAVYSWDELDPSWSLPFLFSDNTASTDRPYRVIERYVISERFALALEMSAASSRYHFTLRFNESLYSFGAATELLAFFVQSLTQLIRNPEADDGGVQARVTFDSVAHGSGAGNNSTATPLPVSRTIEAIAARSEQRPAITDGMFSLTYSELNSSANRVSRLMHTMGLQPGRSRIALHLPRTPDLIVWVLACLKAGVAFVPVDPHTPARRTAGILAALRPDLIVSEEAITGVEIPVLPARPDQKLLNTESDSNLPTSPMADWPAYLMYTSGSTGQPKIVVVSQQNVASYLHAIGDVLGLSKDDRYLHTAAIGFSSAVRQWLLPLVSGGCAMILSRNDLLEPVKLLSKARHFNATLIDLVPSYWRRLVSAARRVDVCLPDSLRLALSASERLDAPLANDILASIPITARLMNMYGLTETSGIVACQTFAPPGPVPDPVPIGHALPGIEIFLMDESGQVAPRGAVGEILVTGSTVALGYLDAVDDHRFVRSPLASHLAAFRTGDLGRQSADGTLVLCGRLDDQIKIRGWRIEPAEIERQLASLPGVDQVVVVSEVQAGEPRLSAHIVAKPSWRVSSAELRAHMERILLDPLVPSRIWVHDALPLTSTGKIDRGRLANMNIIQGENESGDGSPLCQRLAALWSSLMRCGPVGADDDFFALGGHSLLAVDLQAAIAEEFHVDIPWTAIFEASTVRRLALRIAASMQKPGGGE